MSKISRLPDAHGPFGRFATIAAVADGCDVPGWFGAHGEWHRSFAGVAEGGVSPVGGRWLRDRHRSRFVDRQSWPGRSMSDDHAIEHRGENPSKRSRRRPLLGIRQITLMNHPTVTKLRTNVMFVTCAIWSSVPVSWMVCLSRQAASGQAGSLP